MRVLIIEDETKIADFLARGLREAAYEPVIARRGDDGLALALSEQFDICLLDLMLPAIDGQEILRRLRSAGNTMPVLILTAKDTLTDKVSGLEAGADDYLTKPFAFEELLARIRVLLRRSQGISDTLLTVADLVLDQKRRRVERGGREIKLSNREFALLEYLMTNHDCIVTRTMIANHVWDIDFDTYTNTIDVYIRYLREKIETGYPVRLIHTVRGRGYCLSETAP
ncbi:MAG: response regulator transcription factor [Spirochaetaceae bacterium]|nr:response regulator transcription factor [Spirochaetaceae bacterium]